MGIYPECRGQEELIEYTICGKEIKKDESFIDIAYRLNGNHYCSTECAMDYIYSK